MRNIKRLFISLFLVFVFASNVNAGVDPNECNISIKETGITSAGFDAVMPICKKTQQDGFFEVGSRKSSYSAAWAQGAEAVDSIYSAESADGKDFITVHGKIPVCNDPKRRVKAIGTCKLVTKSKTKFCTGQWNANYTACLATEAVPNPTTYFGCLEGWEPYGNLCKKTGGYSSEQIATSNISAQSICQSATGGACSECTTEYALECPAYKCDTEYTQISACTPDFSIGDKAAYCINPTLKFSGSFKHDTTFDVRKCANSYVTEDCGYANILIEGAFHNKNGGISNDAINLALRLWAYHTNGSSDSGFDTRKTGIANRSAADCQTSTYFMKDNNGNRPNVYVNTYNYIMSSHKNEYFEVAQGILNSNGYLPTYLTDPKTNRDKFNGSTFNPINCDKNDKGKIGVVCGGNTTYRVAFELFFNTMIGNKYMMEHLDNLYPNEGKEVEVTGSTVIQYGEWATIAIEFSREDYETIFGEEEVIPCDPNNEIYKKYESKIKPYCQTKFRWYDENGNLRSEKEEMPEECLKGVGCIRRVYKDAICYKKSSGYRIDSVEIQVRQRPSSYSVRKYVACGNTKGEQTMMSYFPEPGKKEKQEVPGESYEKFFYTYDCGVGCKDTNLRINGNEGVCTNENQYTVSVADPSLTCLVNAGDDTSKVVYDKSNEFNVNTNFCRVYCSDRIEYTLPGKKSASSEKELDSGRFFQYNVTTDYSSDPEKMYSVVAKQTRSCVSEIYFDKLPRNVNWKKLYGLTDAENNSLTANLTWTTLFKILANKSASQHDRKEVLNQLVYDLYNCNLYDLNESNMKALGIYKPGDYKVDYALKAIKNRYSGSNAFEAGTSYSDSVYYDGGPKIVTYDDEQEVAISEGARVGLENNYVKTTVDEVNSFINVKYCHSTEEFKCLEYNANAEDYTYKTGFKNSFEKANTYKGLYKYPINNYSLFQYESIAKFYNGHKYQVVPNTGNVAIDSNYANLINLANHSYPLDVYAYNMCANNTCNVTQKVGIKPFFNATGAYKSKLSSLYDQGFKCTVTVDKPITKDGDESQYRNVEPSHLFPLSETGLAESGNWATPEGKEAQKQIESTAGLITSGDELVEYRITLNPTQIKNIKEYNKGAGSYMNERIYGCEKVTASDGDEYYANCKSEFLNKLKTDSGEHDTGQYGNYDLDYDGVSKYNKK